MVQKAAQILTAHPKHFHLHNLIKSIPIVREKKNTQSGDNAEQFSPRWIVLITLVTH